MQHRVAQVCACGLRSEELQIQIQRLFEVVADVLNHLLFGRGGEAGDRDREFASLFLLVFADEVADIEVIDPEVLAPRREAVGLVDDETDDIAGKEDAFDRSRAEHLGRDVEQRGRSILHLFDGQSPRDGIQHAVDGDGLGDASFGEVIHLVLHQRLQG